MVRYFFLSLVPANILLLSKQYIAIFLVFARDSKTINKLFFIAHSKACADSCNSKHGPRYVSSLKALMRVITVFVCASLCAVCGYRFCDRLTCRQQSTTVCQHTRCRNPENGRSWINFRLSAIKIAVVSSRMVYPLI